MYTSDLPGARLMPDSTAARAFMLEDIDMLALMLMLLMLPLMLMLMELEVIMGMEELELMEAIEVATAAAPPYAMFARVPVGQEVTAAVMHGISR